MPFERSVETLNGLIEKTIQEDRQIREGLEEVGYEDREIYDEIGAESGRVWEVALDEIRKYETAEREHEALIATVSAEAGEEPKTGLPEANATSAIVGLLAIILVGLAGWGLWDLVRDWRQSLAALTTLGGWIVPGLALLLFALLAWLLERGRNRDQKFRQAAAAHLAEWRRQIGEIRGKYAVDSAEAALRSQEEAIRKLLYERVRQETISAINRRTAPSYAPRLEIRRPRGFGEIFDKRFTIQTPARRRLQFMLQNMPGGSIGIAGSRGAGKTTLLKLFCGPKRVIETINGKPVLGVLVSAPVAYQAREFILYLFSTACQNVIEAEGGKYDPPGLPVDVPAARLDNPSRLLALQPLPSLLIRFGMVLVLLSLLIGLVLAAVPSLPAASSGPQTTAPTQSKPVAAATGAAPQQQGKDQPDPGQATAPHPTGDPNADGQKAQSAPAVTADEVALFFARWLDLLKINPAPVLALGVSLIVVGLMLAEFLHLGAWRTLMISVAQLLHQSIGWFPVYGRLTGGFLEAQERRIDRDRARWKAQLAEQALAMEAPPGLRNSAETWLKALKFQQSYTSGWSGSLKLPIGLEGGVNRAVTLAQNQLSLPEIGYFFMRFLEETSKKYQVIIGIDELDKLASDELAQQFLNDIKSVFGLERCFYLISVSENAMSNFERRGLPFRDVFDSAFDDFVYVDHLDFESAKELLEQRVVGRPIAFFAMSYCMSGGLARDLIRNFRSVLEVHEQDKTQDGLTAICRRVVASDLLAKLRATRTSAKKIRLEPEVDQFLEQLYALEAGVDDDDLLVKAASDLLAKATAPERVAKAPTPAVPQRKPKNPPAPNAQASDDVPTPSEDKERAAKVAELAELAEEVATYIQYALTLRQMFNDALQQAALTNPPVNGNLDTLAKARQVLGLNPAITRGLLRSFRAAHDLPPFP